MSYADVVNGVIVSRCKDYKKPVKVARGVWLREIFINEKCDSTINMRTGPSVEVKSDSVVYTYSICQRDDAIERYKRMICILIYDKQIEKENSGIIFQDTFVPTDDETVAKALIALDGSRKDPDKIRKVNFRDCKRLSATMADLESLTNDMDDHKQAAHDWGFGISELVDAATTIEELTEIKNQI